MASQGSSAVSSRRPGAHADAAVMIGQFRRLEDIGRGSFATVYRGVHLRKRSLVAIKSVQLFRLNSKLKANLYSEIKILRSLHHPHIVALIDCQESSQHIHLVMEFCQLGDLSAFIKKRSSLGNHPATTDMIRKYPNPPVGGLNEVVVRHFLKQIASALEFLRAKNYVHRDIKPQNLLLNPSPHFFAQEKPEMMPMAVTENSLVPAAGVESLPMLKVADFGFARVLPQTSLAETLCGSPLYMAPEILRYERYDAKADLWSVGTVLHEMMVGKPPFRASNHVELLRKIEKQDDKIRFPEDIYVSDGMKKLIRGLLKKQPTERMSFENFFDHAVVREPIPGLADEDLPRELEPQSPALSRRQQKQPAGLSDSFKEQDEQEPKPSEAQPSTPLDTQEQNPSGTSSSSRPQSRASPVIPTSSPPPRQPLVARRYSNSPTHGTGQPAKSHNERRPGIISHQTAPARPELLQRDRSPVAAAVAMERRHSRNTSSPGSSFLRENLDKERPSQRIDERAAKEARERAAQDVAFERDYVLVEKRAVEVNAFADELAASPQLQSGRPTSPRTAIVRRATASGATPTSNAPVQGSPSRAMQIIPSRQRPETVHRRTSSYERRYGPSPGSATSAISKALNLANIRLFGMGFSPPLVKGSSPPQGYGAFPTYPTAKGSLLLLGDTGRALDTLDEDTKVVLRVEELATRSDVVYGFAEVKFKQLLPASPSHDQGLGIGQTSGSERPYSDTSAVEDDDLTVDAVVAISEEALVLYVKALAILAKSIDLAGSWWGQKNRGEVIGEGALAPRSHSPKAAIPAVGTRMNNVVQWARNRFNECVEKSEFVGRKLVDAQKQLPLDHPGHPSNHPSASAGSATSIGTSAENINLTSGVTAEKLMYERAVEMSRAAAVNELVGEDLAGCEIAYKTAIRMLEAVLEGDDEPSAARTPRWQQQKRESGRVDDDVIDGLETEDRQTVVKLVEGTSARLKSLKKKIEAQKAVKRTSMTPVAKATPGLPGRSVSSPSMAPAHGSPR